MDILNKFLIIFAVFSLISLTIFSAIYTLLLFVKGSFPQSIISFFITLVFFSLSIAVIAHVMETSDL